MGLIPTLWGPRALARFKSSTSANYKSHQRNLTAVSLQKLHAYMCKFPQQTNHIKVSLKVLKIPRRTKTEIDHNDLSGSQMDDLITIICKLIQPICNKITWCEMRKHPEHDCTQYLCPNKNLKRAFSLTVSVYQNISLTVHLMLVIDTLFPICNTFPDRV